MIARRKRGETSSPAAPEPVSPGGTDVLTQPEPVEQVASAAAPAAAPAGKSAASRSRRSNELATPPAVNLLSPWVLEELRVLRMRNRFIVGGLALVVLVGLLWTGLTLRLHQTEEEVRGEETVANGLASQIRDLSDVRTYISTVKNRQLTAAALVAGQIQMSRSMEVLAASLPNGARFDTVALTLTTEEAPAPGGTAEAPCPGPDPFGANTVIGCVTISGTADDRTDVSTFVERLTESPMFVEPFVETTTKGNDRGVTFTGTVGLTPDARHGDVDEQDGTDGTDGTDTSAQEGSS